METNREKELFDLIHKTGEILEGNLHIIDMSEDVDYYFDGERKYRVYHKDGYCFDVERLVNSWVDETESEVKDYYYNVYDEWDGFEKLDALGYFNLLVYKS